MLKAYIRNILARAFARGNNARGTRRPTFISQQTHRGKHKANRQTVVLGVMLTDSSK